MKLERIVALSLALYACPKDEEIVDAGILYDAGSMPSEFEGDPCTMEGEVLFEDGFEGDDLDLSEWKTNLQEGQIDEYAQLKNGTLEITTAGTYILQSHSTYVIDERPLIFESRWKVREREGTYIHSGFVGPTIDGDGVLFGRGSYTDWLLSYDIGAKNCGGTNGPLEPEPDLTTFHTFKAVIYGERVSFCVDGELKEKIGSNCLPLGRDLTASITCQSEDGEERRCDFDYVKVMQGR